MFYTVTWNDGGFETFGCAMQEQEFNTYAEALKFAQGEALSNLNQYGGAPDSKVIICESRILKTLSK